MDIPDLGVAHEPVAKTDGVSVSKKGAIGVFVCEGIHVRGIRSVDGIALHALLWGDPPAIVDAAEVSSERATLERRRTSDTLCSSPEPCRPGSEISAGLIRCRDLPVTAISGRTVQSPPPRNLGGGLSRLTSTISTTWGKTRVREPVHGPLVHR